VTRKTILQSNLRLQQMTTVRDGLIAAFEAGDDIELSLAADAQTDLSFVQLVESARKLAVKKGIRLTMAAPATGELAQTLQRGGFLDAGTSSAAFWLGMEAA
jgi:hypothetical protein